MSFFRTAVLILAAPTLVSAQNLRGEIQTGQSRGTETLQVEAYSESQHTALDRTVIGSSGSFEFFHLAPGNYTLRVLTQTGELVTTVDVSHQLGQGPVRVRLPESRESHTPAGVTSVAALINVPSKRAVAEFRKSEESQRHQDPEGAMAHLRNAIAISPKFAQAHTNLGALLSQSSRFAEAEHEFEAALQTGTAGATEHLNLSVVLFAMKRFDEAEAAVRAALKVDASSAKAHYLLGRALMRHREQWDEARRNLQFAAKEFPAASSFLSQISAR